MEDIFTNIRKTCCRTTDIELQIFHDVWLKISLEILTSNSRRQCFNNRPIYIGRFKKPHKNRLTTKCNELVDLFKGHASSPYNNRHIFASVINYKYMPTNGW